MSLRGGPGSPVQTEIQAGPFPAGPTHKNVVLLNARDICAGDGSIFRRRFDRPGNSMIRNHQAEFRLPPHIPNQPPAYSLSSDKANPGDSPLHPPTALLDRLPNFAACDPDKCGNHDNSADGDTPAECHKCGTSEPLRSMHRLPCGHHLCSADLTLTAINAAARADSAEPQVMDPLMDAVLELGLLRRDLAPVEVPHVRAAQEARMHVHRTAVLEVLGLACCGTDMQLVQDWVLCLDEWAARGLEAATRGLLQGEEGRNSARCGWPDCEELIPTWCTYLRDGEIGWYCVACGGNSKWQSQALGPAR
ncbi:Dihydroorotate dehydrogenase (quinone), mitochondrial [Diaporthe australafricana]|uniref:Dihydroorotate dehydrogenase (Quinone), mitochondrial n=1 Tax=Diaporthe australafricana TaxID=127596 RepID=A0ABR3WJQ1_9PEZI